MAKWTRREWLAWSAKSLAAAGSAQWLSGCPVVPLPPNAPSDDVARVAAVKGTDLAAMTRDIIAQCGGAESFMQPGERVLIKPNFGGFGLVKYNPVQAGDSAKPEIVLATAEECLNAGASEVIIAEGGQSNIIPWNIVYTLDGTTNMIDAVADLNKRYPNQSVSLVSLNSESPDWIELPSYNKFGKVIVSSLLLDVDRVISIPVVKTHRWTQVTASMKNFVGTTPTHIYGLGVQWRMILHDAGIEQSFLDIVRGVKPDFTIVDCSICCEGNGPHVCPGYWGTTVDMRDRLGSWLLLAGSDLPAVDATAARVIGLEPAEVDHLVMAYQQGLGQVLEDKIQIVGATLDELRVTFEPADQTEGFQEVLLPGLHLLTDC